MQQTPQMININGTTIPILLTKTSTKTTQVIGVQGLIQIKQNKDDIVSLRTILIENADMILDIFNSMSKKIVLNREWKEYINMCKYYVDEYTKELGIKPVRVRQRPLLIDRFGKTYKDGSITLNSYMMYMNEDIIKNTIWHELCHVYTLEKYGTMKHDDVFYSKLYEKYSKEENEKILNS